MDTTGKKKSRAFFFSERKRTLTDLALSCLLDGGKKTSAAYKVLLALRYFSEADHTARVALSIIADGAGISRWAVRRGIKELAACRIITIIDDNYFRLWTGPAHVLGRLVKEDQKRPYAEQKIPPRLGYWIKKHETQDKNNAERRIRKQDQNVIGKELIK